jgi:hypothetical protein
VATLADFGTPVMAFVQRELIKEHLGTERSAKFGVTDGACHGICLQWVRRQLLSKKGEAQRVVYEPGAKTQKAVVKGVTAQVVRKTADTWDGFVSKMDEIRGKKAGRPEAYQFRDIDRFQDDKQSDARVAAYVASVCSISGFQDGGCALIGCAGADPKATGHTVALLKRGAGYFLFDPNYGIYKIESTDNLGRAIQWVFCEDSTGIKATDGACVCNYELFRRKQ